MKIALHRDEVLIIMLVLTTFEQAITSLRKIVIWSFRSSSQGQ